MSSNVQENLNYLWDDVQALVVKTGSCFTFAGFAGDDAPRAVFPSIVGKSRFSSRHFPGIFSPKDFYVGDEAQSKRGILRLMYPYFNGRVRDWELLEKIWHHTFYNELCVAPEEHPVILTHQVITSDQDKEKMAQIMFETFNVPALYLADESILSMASTGQVTGVIVHCGWKQCRVVSVVEYSVVRDSYFETDIGSFHVEEALIRELAKVGQIFTTTAEREIVEEMVRSSCFVSNEFATESESDKYVELYENPSGMLLSGTVSQIVRSTEVPFQPWLVAQSWVRTRQAICESCSLPGVLIDNVLKSYLECMDPCYAVHEMVINSVKKCDQEFWQRLLSNIYICGGPSLSTNFGTRLKHEIQKTEKIFQVEVKEMPERKYMSWIGGSIIGSSVCSSEQRWITKEEYDEHGPSIAHRKQ